MNEQDIRELLKLIRGIEHFLERCLKTITEKQLEEKGVEIVQVDEPQSYITTEITGFEF